ncbi:hypothetical protein D3C86_2188010 [compost metagenome]
MNPSIPVDIAPLKQLVSVARFEPNHFPPRTKFVKTLMTHTNVHETKTTTLSRSSVKRPFIIMSAIENARKPTIAAATPNE